MLITIILIGAAVITACAVNLKPSKAADEPTAMPTILDGAVAEYTGQPQKIVTDLPAGMRYFITTDKIDPTTIDAGKIVPKGYTALDYLQGTGTQYIDTGFATTTGMVAKFAAQWNAFNGEGGSNCVVGNSDKLNNYALLNSNNTWQLGFGNVVKYSVDTGELQTKYVVQFSTISSDGYLDVNGNRLIADTGVRSTNNANVLLFTTQIQYVSSKSNIYNATIWSSDGKLVRDFVPVRADNGTLGMYDLVGNKLYENNGTGEFIAGDAVNTAIKDWQWLDSVNATENNVVLDANTTYYVYYYTPNTDTTTVTPLAVKEFTVQCNTHVYGDWQTKQPATCTTDGVRERVCQGCGHTETEVAPALGHDYEKTFVGGKTVYTCSRCGDTYGYDCIDEDGHNFIPYQTEPKCESGGFTTYTCDKCGHSYQSDFVPATGHSYGAWVTIEPATADHAGVQKRTCEVCGAEQERTLPALAGSTTNGGKDNSGPLLWGIIIGVIAVLAGCGGLAWLLIVLFKPKHQKQEKVAAA